MRYERALAISNRHERLIALIRAGEFSSSDLAEQLEMSEQTIYRDVDFLKGKGYSIRSVRLSRGWAYQLISELATPTDGAESSKR